MHIKGGGVKATVRGCQRRLARVGGGVSRALPPAASRAVAMVASGAISSLRWARSTYELTANEHGASSSVPVREQYREVDAVDMAVVIQVSHAMLVRAVAPSA